jgi:hypothetical protein
MRTLFDMMLQAQNGQAMEQMAKQFGLAQEQAKQAMAALMPAFSTGLKHSAANPYDFSALMAAAGTGGYAKYFEDLGKAFTPEGIADGNSLLGRLFGSKEVSRAIAAQAEQMSGINQEVYKQMMPVMANSLVGGFFKQVAEQFQNAGEAVAAGRPGDIYQDWLRTLGLAPAKPQPNPLLDNPLMQTWQAMLGGAGNASEQARPAFENPFIRMLEMMNGIAGTEQSGAAADKPADKPSAENQYLKNIGSLFESGIEVQKSYQKSVEDIFENYFSSGKPSA